MPVYSSGRTFRFGNQATKSLGIIELALETPPNILSITVLVVFVDFDIPALIGLDVLNGYDLL